MALTLHTRALHLPTGPNFDKTILTDKLKPFNLYISNRYIIINDDSRYKVALN